MASIRKISLLPRLDVAGTSVLSGMSALANKGLLEGMPVRSAFVRLTFHTPIAQPPGPVFAKRE